MASIGDGPSGLGDLVFPSSDANPPLSGLPAASAIGSDVPWSGARHTTPHCQIWTSDDTIVIGQTPWPGSNA